MLLLKVVKQLAGRVPAAALKEQFRFARELGYTELNDDDIRFFFGVNCNIRNDSLHFEEEEETICKRKRTAPTLVDPIKKKPSSTLTPHSTNALPRALPTMSLFDQFDNITTEEQVDPPSEEDSDYEETTLQAQINDTTMPLLPSLPHDVPSIPTAASNLTNSIQELILKDMESFLKTMKSASTVQENSVLKIRGKVSVILRKLDDLERKVNALSDTCTDKCKMHAQEKILTSKKKKNSF